MSAHSTTSTDSVPEKPRVVVIAGAGIIGTSTAFYLAKNHGIKTIIVDPTGEIAPAASGKAGGFLAETWNDHSPPLSQLTRRSFVLHQELADHFTADRIQYRRLTCAGIRVGENKKQRPSGKKLEGVEWADDAVGSSSVSESEFSSSTVLGMQPLGDESNIAQVHPKMLCRALWTETSKPIEQGGVGSELMEGSVDGPIIQDGKLVGVKLSDGQQIEADSLLWSCGPWTRLARDGFDLMYGVKYHSAIIPTPRVFTQSVFFSGCGDPEVYPRPDGTAYCTGFPDPAVKVKEFPGKEQVSPDAINRIASAVATASNGVLSETPTIEQACYLPSTPDGMPLMGRLDECGTFVAAGHGCWGILLGPASGESMAHLIATGSDVSEHMDLRPLSPKRFGVVRIEEGVKT